MKQSHERAPRTMREAQWTQGSTSGPVYRAGFDWQDIVVMVACAGAVLALVAMAWAGWL